jgi:hypothetical protein
MKQAHGKTLAAAMACTLSSFGVHAQQTGSPAPAAGNVTSPTAPVAPAVTRTPTSLSFDRIAFSANGASLTGTNGGGGGSLGWLHNFDPDKLVGIAAEHQVLFVARWTFGSVNGSITVGPGDQRYTIYGEAHEGAGDDGNKAFKYRVEGLGVTGTYFHRLSATVEDKQFNVETTHGNLPKAGLSYLWNAHVQTAIGYQYSFGGNLGTRLTSGRIDLYEPSVNFLGGFAVGRAAPSVFNAPTPQGFGGLTLPPHNLTEGYVGLAKSLPHWRSDLTLILDYQHLSGGPTIIGNVPGFLVPTTRWTGTLNYVYHVNGM